MEAERSLVLSSGKVQQKLDRIAREIHERYFGDQDLVMIGVADRGYQVAQKLNAIVEEISDLRPELGSLSIDKDDPLATPPELSITPATLKDRPVLLVDDVLNSGKTLIHATHCLLEQPLKSLATVTLVDRKHRSFPIKADFVGLTLATTLKQHISVVIEEEQIAVYLD